VLGWGQMNVEDVAINLLAGHVCSNCHHYSLLWCHNDHNEDSIMNRTCHEWIEKQEMTFNFSITKNRNPCIEIPLKTYNVCALGTNLES